MPDVDSYQALRADAERNRKRILAAAEQVFALQGERLKMQDVAERAGVGKATLYRTFPTRASLINAMAVLQLGRFRDRAQAAEFHDNPLDALRDLLLPNENPAAVGAAALSGLTAHHISPDLAQVQSEAIAALDHILERAKADGLIRPHVNSRHLTVLFTGVARSLTWEELTDGETYRDYSQLIFGAICLNPHAESART
jgi:AcrR family transcriptional regulator